MPLEGEGFILQVHHIVVVVPVGFVHLNLLNLLRQLQTLDVIILFSEERRIFFLEGLVFFLYALVFVFQLS